MTVEQIMEQERCTVLANMFCLSRRCVAEELHRRVERIMTEKTYTVMATQGQGGCPVEHCATLEEALAYVEQHQDEASFGIIYPNGQWHKWSQE